MRRRRAFRFYLSFDVINYVDFKRSTETKCLKLRKKRGIFVMSGEIDKINNL